MALVQDRGTPSIAAVAIATGIIGIVTGYFIGQGASLGLFGGSSRTHTKHAPNSEDDDSDEDDYEGPVGEDESLGDANQELGGFPGNNEECKLVLVVRTDLGMTKGGVLSFTTMYYLKQLAANTVLWYIGKIAAQCGHATLACYKVFLHKSPNSPVLRRWERYGQAKVAVQVKSEDELLMLQAQAISLGVCAQVIHDAGRTQIASGSATVLGVGPAPKSVVDQVTGHLKLLWKVMGGII
jgi:peptidyl-tRNA hydrolase